MLKQIQLATAVYERLSALKNARRPKETVVLEHIIESLQECFRTLHVRHKGCATQLKFEKYFRRCARQ